MLRIPPLGFLLGASTGLVLLLWRSRTTRDAALWALIGGGIASVVFWRYGYYSWHDANWRQQFLDQFAVGTVWAFCLFLFGAYQLFMLLRPKQH
jgi:hypothetical protein